MSTDKSIIGDPNDSVKAARIAEIHVLAMQSNPLLHAQFPTPESQAALEHFLAKDASKKLAHPLTGSQKEEGIRLASDKENGEIFGFITWDYPGRHALLGPPSEDKKKLEEGEIKKLPGCRSEYLDEYARLAKEAKERSGFNQKRCWHLTFVCVDPKYQGRGLGSELTQRFLDEIVEAAQGGDAKLPVYLESTMEAVSMYERLGFEKEDWFEMKIPVMRRGGGSEGSEGEGKREGEEEMMTYREVCMVYYPYTRY
ncbi:hypothetical protein QBC45DRAFT_220597 [Copromyces sp. CBS 386.78]|nr:hypothetical protein QBC45DRAFT_220597 [Copromyces sp. CBS 386.78]